ncbi:L-threonine 3-dehydrogenase [candidate division WOR-3 bacterium]|nr:L-threonine 3-dehydrogenase [candidate division WOR-3 bacterium]
MLKRILVTGSAGQIGSELTMYLRGRYGSEGIVAGIHRTQPSEKIIQSGPVEKVDCRDYKALTEIVEKHKIEVIYHLAAILSATGEQNPQLAWDINMNGLYNVLEIAREKKCAVFVPSSIAAFGPETPKDKTPQDTIQRVSTMYGVTKVAGELLSDYYFNRFGVDTRGLRYPGIISYETPPGGGTTDYAVEIFYEAIKKGKYGCFLKSDTMLDMMYMPDCLKSTVELMEADPSKLKHRNAFNVTAFSCTPELLAEEIKKHIPEFSIYYEIDEVKQSIANSWPNSLDDSAARDEWGWKPDYTLSAMTKDMLEKLSKKING